MMGGRSRAEWIAQYATSHQHPVNRACHTVGIPTVALSVALLIAAALGLAPWGPGAALFVVGWIIQLVGHAFEGKPPEFFKDPRFLLVGLSWWWEKLRGRA